MDTAKEKTEMDKTEMIDEILKTQHNGLELKWDNDRKLDRIEELLNLAGEWTQVEPSMTDFIHRHYIESGEGTTLRMAEFVKETDNGFRLETIYITIVDGKLVTCSHQRYGKTGKGKTTLQKIMREEGYQRLRLQRQMEKDQIWLQKKGIEI